MKQLLTNLLVLLAAFSLVSCSSNTQSQNTTAGTVAGAVVGGLTGSFIGQGTGKLVAIGVGAIAGGLIGGYIGKNMDHSDCVHTYSALDHNAPNKAKHWKNKKTQTSYTVTPTSNVMSYNGNNVCRQYNTTATTADGKSQTSSGIACRQSNGTWQEVKSAS